MDDSNIKVSKDWNKYGVEYYSIQEFDKSIECYDKAIKLDPTNVYAWSNRGNAYLAKKSYDKAIECFEEAIKLDPDYAEARDRLGAAYEDMKKYYKAKSGDNLTHSEKLVYYSKIAFLFCWIASFLLIVGIIIAIIAEQLESYVLYINTFIAVLYFISPCLPYLRKSFDSGRRKVNVPCWLFHGIFIHFFTLIGFIFNYFDMIYLAFVFENTGVIIILLLSFIALFFAIMGLIFNIKAENY